MVGDDYGCMQPGNVFPPSVASYSSPWHGVSYADVECLPASCSLPEDSPSGLPGEPLQQIGLQQGSLDLGPVSFGVSSGTDFDTTAASFSYLDWENSAELGPYSEFRPSHTSGLGSLGQYLTFSALDGSQRHLEYVPLSDQAIKPRNAHVNSTPPNFIPESTLPNEGLETINTHFDFASNPFLTTPSETGSSQLFSPDGPCLDTASSNLSPIINFDHADQTSSGLDFASDPIHCLFPSCGKSFTQKHLYNKHCKFHTRPFQCPRCPRSFATMRDVSRHASVAHHQPSVVYHCEVPNCKYGKQSLGRGMFFTRKDNLVRHMRGTHGRTSSSGV